jgi:hypothetical protein
MECRVFLLRKKNFSTQSENNFDVLETQFLWNFQGPMLWSLFPVIFADFMRKNGGFLENQR